MIKFYLFVRRDHPPQGKHNALQKSAYFTMPILAVIIVLSVIAIWKPVTLGFITALFVNYKWRVFVHFTAMGGATACSPSCTCSWSSPWTLIRCARWSRAGTTARIRPKPATHVRSITCSDRENIANPKPRRPTHEPRSASLHHHLCASLSSAFLAACEANPKSAPSSLHSRREE
jgi:hypothetical protein